MEEISIYVYVHVYVFLWTYVLVYHTRVWQKRFIKSLFQCNEYIYDRANETQSKCCSRPKHPKFLPKDRAATIHYYFEVIREKKAHNYGNHESATIFTRFGEDSLFPSTLHTRKKYIYTSGVGNNPYKKLVQLTMS